MAQYPGSGGPAADRPQATGAVPGGRWVLASGNPSKAREFEALLRPLDVAVVLQSALGIPEADEPFPTFVENALAKARHAARESNLVAIADDSGICVPAIGGAPGVHSARYAAAAGTVPLPRELQDAANNRRLIEASESGTGRLPTTLAPSSRIAAALPTTKRFGPVSMSDVRVSSRRTSDTSSPSCRAR